MKWIAMGLVWGLVWLATPFTTPALAQDGGVMSNLGVFFPLIALIAIFYFFIIRPQNKKLRDHREMVASLRRGDVVITSGGIIGKVHRIVDDNECVVEIADNVRVKVVKTTITAKHMDTPSEAKADKKADKS